MNLLQGFYLGLRRYFVHVTQMGDSQAFIIEQIQHIGRGIFFLLCSNTNDKHVTNFVLARANQGVGIALNCLKLVMPRCIVADADDFCFQFERR